MNKIKVAVDLDDTLALTIQGTLQYASKRLGTELAFGDIRAVEYWAKYGVSDTEAISLVHAYNEAGFPGLKPMPEAMEVLRQLTGRYAFYIVTARQADTATATDIWVRHHFPDIFTDIIYTGNPFVSNEARSKETVCAELGVSLLIDDSLSHINACEEIGITGILFGDHPWHPATAEPQLFVRAEDWKAVKEYFDAKS